jgi:hypothetical protein
MQLASKLALRIKPPIQLTMSAAPEVTFPEGFDRVGNKGFLLRIDIHPHDHSRAIVFLVGARANQCVLLRLMVPQSGRLQWVQPVSHWEQPLWFDPEHPLTEEQLSVILNQSVNKMMRELKDAILSA